MYKKFAKISYKKPEKKQDIYDEYDEIENTSDFKNDFIIKIDKENIIDALGQNIKLPFTEKEFLQNGVNKMKTILDMKNIFKMHNIDIVWADKSISDNISDVVHIADISNIFPFFILQGAKKALKATGKDIRDCEVLIINKDNALTEKLIDVLYNDVNFLTIIGEKTSENLQHKAEDIFYDTGLSIRFGNISKSNAKNADVIINTGYKEGKLDYSYKKNAVYFNICNKEDNFNDLILKRNDMFIIDGLKLSYKKTSLTLEEIEIYFYLKLKEYRYFINNEYSYNILLEIIEFIEKSKISVVGFYQNGKSISVSSLFSLGNNNIK